MTDTPDKVPTKTNRRRFLSGLAIGAGIAPLASLWRQPVTAGPAAAATDLCYTTDKPWLTPQDFSLLGHNDLQPDGLNTTYMRGLTHRYVNGQLRFMTLSVEGRLMEFVLPGAFGQNVQGTTNIWDISAAIGDHTGIWWEEARQRLWVTASIDYGDADTYYPTKISTLTLGANGAVSNLKTVSLQGVASKRVYGGVQPVPAWMRSQHGLGPYVVGFGGYTSLMAQRSRAPLGPSLIAIPDVDNYSNGAEIPSSAFRVLLDTPTTDRGVRKTIPLNYFDGSPEWLTYPPTAPPDPRSLWLSPNAQGLGWMVWGDSYYNTGAWIDGPNKQGFVAIGSLGKGKCWYQGSTLNFEDRQYELHIWDSKALTAGPLTRPTHMQELVVPRGLDPAWGLQGNTVVSNLSGATFDPQSGRYYAVGYALGPNVNWGRLYSYRVTA